MFKKLFFLIPVLFFSFSMSAQNDFKIGLRGGLNFPDVWGNEYAKYQDFKIGYLVGVSFEQPIIKNWTIKANLNYERKTKKFELVYYNWNAEKTGTENFRHAYNYINFPVLLKYEFGNSGIFANAGPFLNYLLSDRVKPNDPYDDNMLRPEHEKLDFGLSAGIGFAFPLDEKNELNIELRDDLGLSDIGGVPPHISGTQKTNTVKLILGWNLGI